MEDPKNKNKDLGKSLFEVKLNMSKSKYLSKKYGGVWKYDGQSCWWCDDGKRHVARTGTIDEEYYSPCWSIYYLYGGENGTEVVWWD